MAYSSEADLEETIFDELKTELQNEPLFNADVLALKVKDSIREFKRRRAYVNSGWTDEKILADMDANLSIIKQYALVLYNRMGSEGELVHYENTVHRSYMYDDDIFSNVIPFVKVLF